jgi:hypothetical protein
MTPCKIYRAIEMPPLERNFVTSWPAWSVDIPNLIAKTMGDELRERPRQQCEDVNCYKKY